MLLARIQMAARCVLYIIRKSWWCRREAVRRRRLEPLLHGLPGEIQHLLAPASDLHHTPTGWVRKGLAMSKQGASAQLQYRSFSSVLRLAAVLALMSVPALGIAPSAAHAAAT